MNAKDVTNSNFERLFPEVEESSRLSVCCRRGDFSASRIATAVEDCDAHLLNLNVTETPEGGSSDFIYVDLRINRADPTAVTRSLLRYGYQVTDVISPVPRDIESVRDRINELLYYLEL